MSVIQKILNEETRWIAQQEGRVVSDMMDIYKSTLAEIRGEIKGLKKGGYSHTHARAIQAQLEAKVATMRVKMSESMGRTMTKTYARAQVRERNALAKLEKTFGDASLAQQYQGFTPVVPNRAIKKLITTQGIAIKGLSDEVTRDVRKLGVARSLVRGEGTEATVRRLQKMDLPLREGRVRLVVRMETARSVNEAKSETLVQAAKKFGEDIWQMFKDHVERSAKTRNHWLSWVLSGTVRNVTKGEYFEVHNAEIQATKAAYQQITRRSAKDSGILMEKFSKGLRTKGGVGHYWERGNIFPWKPKWGATFGAVKHPQGPIENTQKDALLESLKPFNKRSKEVTNDLKLLAKKNAELRQKVMFSGFEHSDLKIFERNRKAAHKELFSLTQGKADLDIDFKFYDVSRNGPSPILLPQSEKAAFEAELRDSAKFLENLLGENVMRGERLPVYHWDEKDFRAFYDPNYSEMYINRRADMEHKPVFVHELSHWLEHKTPGLSEKSLYFWEERTRNDKGWVSLADLFPDDGYEIDEKVKVDNFLDPYMGKLYWAKGGSDRDGPDDFIVGTELITMGFEFLYRDPLYLIENDPNYFEFLLEVVEYVAGKN